MWYGFLLLYDCLLWNFVIVKISDLIDYYGFLDSFFLSFFYVWLLILIMILEVTTYAYAFAYTESLWVLLLVRVFWMFNHYVYVHCVMCDILRNVVNTCRGWERDQEGQYRVPEPWKNAPLMVAPEPLVPQVLLQVLEQIRDNLDVLVPEV